MKTAILFATAAFAVTSLPLVAQQASATSDQNASATAGRAQVNQSTNANASADPGSVQANGASSTNAEMRPVNAELVGKLDSKSAKVGDPVAVKTTAKSTTADGLTIPKGSRLTGHVTEVAAHEKGHADSSLGIVFDHAELRGGQNIAIHSVIETVAPPANAVAASSADEDSGFSGGAPMGGGVRGGGGGRAGGGGLVGGATGLAGGATANATSNVNAGAGQLARTTGNVAGDATGTVDNGIRTTAGATGSLATHATAIPGVMLSSDAATSASGTLTAANRNVHLDSGTQMVLGLSAAAAH